MAYLPALFESDFNFLISETQSGKNSTELRDKLPREKRNSNNIARSFYPLIFIMRLGIACPITIDNGDGNIIYRVKYFSFVFIVSFIFWILLGVTLVVWVLNSIFEIYWPAQIFGITTGGPMVNESTLRESSIILLLNRLMRATVPVGAWLLMSLQWTNLKYLCQFLNGWSKFLQKYNKTFSSVYEPRFNVKKYRNIYFALWVFPVAYLIAVAKPSLIIYWGIPQILVVSIGYMQMLSIMLTFSFSYVRDYLMLKTLSIAYREILNGMKAEYAHNKKSISKRQVDNWMDLILLTRKQAFYLGTCLGLSNLWSILLVFIALLLILCMVAFLFVNDQLNMQVASNFLPFAAFIATFFSTSLYGKAYIAEGIRTTVENIVEEVVKMETSDKDFDARLMMKQMCDLLHNSPTDIIIGNTLTLNKPLLMSFFSQLASYLVVLLQLTKTQ